MHRANLRAVTRVNPEQASTVRAVDADAALTGGRLLRGGEGLERPVIVLTGIDDLSPEDEKRLLYVGLSRARVYLVIAAAPATIGRLTPAAHHP